LKTKLNQIINRILALSLLSALFLLTACGQNGAIPGSQEDQDQNPPQITTPIHTTEDLETYHLIQSQLPSYETEVLEFNSGDRIYISPYDRQMP
jgi:predicted small lipoprotein YifL